jgi:hypothetical protein
MKKIIPQIIVFLFFLLIREIFFTHAANTQNVFTKHDTTENYIMIPLKLNPAAWLMTDPSKDVPKELIHSSGFRRSSPCAYEDDDDIIVFPGFGVSVSSLDVCLDDQQSASHSEVSVFVDPNNKYKVRTSDMARSENFDRLRIDYFSSDTKGIYWNWGLLNNVTYFNTFSDPSTVLDNNSIWYTGFLEKQEETSTDPMLNVSIGVNNGTGWAGPYIVSSVNTDYDPYTLDKPHLWIDNSNSQYGGHMYAAWTPFPIQLQQYNNPYPNFFEIEFSNSSSGGVTWHAPVVISQNLYEPGTTLNQGVNIQTGPNGEVYAVWAGYFFDERIPFGTLTQDVYCDENALFFIRSDDGGQSFYINDQVNTEYHYGQVIQEIHGIRNYAANQYGWVFQPRINSFPSMCVDNSDGPYKGRIYIVWANHGPVEDLNFTEDRIDVYMIYSDQNGNIGSWNGPIRINQGRWLNDQEELIKSHAFFPWISCDQESGVLTVIYYADDEYTVNENCIDAYVAMSKDYGTTWEESRVSDYRSTPGEYYEAANYYFFGDYIGIFAQHGLAYPVWTDMRNSQEIPGSSGEIVCVPQAYTSPYYIWNCVDHYDNLIDVIPSYTIREWDVSDYITSRNIIQSNAHGVYNAGNEIVLLAPEDPEDPNSQGFHATSGSFVHAFIEGCEPFEDQFVNRLANSGQSGEFNVAGNQNGIKAEIQVFPNPTDGQITVNLPQNNEREYTLRIFDENSVERFSVKSVKSQAFLDISAFPAGMYALDIRSDNHSAIFKIVKY